jgi:hypothetical protein
MKTIKCNRKCQSSKSNYCIGIPCQHGNEVIKDKKYKFIGCLGKTKYYVTSNGWLAKAINKKFVECGYIEDNQNVWDRLLKQV